MELWPADFRADSAAPKRKGRKGKEVHKLNEQTIEHGTLGAATLTSGDNALKWMTLVQQCSTFCIRSPRGPVEVFPATRSPPVVAPKLSLQNRAKEALQFIQGYYPDVDVPLPLLKEELLFDDDEAVAAAILDPYTGIRLAQLSFIKKPNKVRHFLAFVTGETNAELNISPFHFDIEDRYIFRPSAEPVLTFDTPILQLAPFMNEGTETFCLLAVRTHAVISIVKIQGKSRRGEGQPIVANIVTTISPSDTGNCRVVDMAPGLQSSSNARVLLVNDIGIIYDCKIQGAKMTLESVSDISMPDDQEWDNFWRIAWRDHESCMRASSKKVELFSLRVNIAGLFEEGRALQLTQQLSLEHSNEVVTSIIYLRGIKPMICVATTSKLRWFEDGNTDRPLMSLKHGRAFDRSLRLSSFAIGSSTFVALSSALNSLVTLYEASVTPSGHLQLQGMPSVLPGCSFVEYPVAGSLLYPHQTKFESSVFWHFQLSFRGSLWQTEISFSDRSVSQTPEPSSSGFEWDDGVSSLAKRASKMVPDVGKLGQREYTVADLRDMYDKLFSVRGALLPQSEDPEAVYQTLDKMPFFWQHMDEPVEHMLTTFDIAFQSGRQPLHEFRADFLTGSSLSLPRGFVALMNARLPIEHLASTASWYHDISTLPCSMIPDLNVPLHLLIDKIQQEAVSYAEGPQGVARAINASQQLVLDLALSCHVYSPQSFTRSVSPRHVKSALDELSTATQAMSLRGRSTAGYIFGFFRPTVKVPCQEDEPMGSDDDTGAGASLKLSAGIRILLSEWEIGANPAEYIYKDHYDYQEDLSERSVNKAQNVYAPTQKHIAPPIVQTSVVRPPVVLPSSSRLPVTQLSQPRQTVSTRPDSSPPHHMNEFASQVQYTYSSSQELLGPSTQPLPGPFGGGGREIGAAKKKAIKKRMGGF